MSKFAVRTTSPTTNRSPPPTGTCSAPATNERDVALIRADGRGIRNGKPKRLVTQLVDYRDLDSGYTAMQRTVGFPMSIGAQMILNGVLTQRGVINPSEVPFEPFLAEIRKRGLDITKKVETWDGNEEPGLE